MCLGERVCGLVFKGEVDCDSSLVTHKASAIKATYTHARAHTHTHTHVPEQCSTPPCARFGEASKTTVEPVCNTSVPDAQHRPHPSKDFTSPKTHTLLTHNPDSRIGWAEEKGWQVDGEAERKRMGERQCGRGRERGRMEVKREGETKRGRSRETEREGR